MIPPILITGCARSGTSLTAGVIDICGGFGGRTTPPTAHNKKGQFENDEIRNNIVKPYLRSMGVDPLGQFPLPERDQLIPYPNLKIQVEAVLKWDGYKGGPWYYKGAKICLIWPIWYTAFPRAKWIIVRRRDEDIVASCMRTHFMKAFENEAGWHWWVREHKDRFEDMKIFGLDMMEFWPTHAVAGDLSETKKMIDWLGLEWKESEVIKFIEPVLWSMKDG